jgi:hypothetical protein
MWSKPFTMALLAALAGCATPASTEGEARLVDVGPGWANNSVNAVVFRKNALASHGDTQYIAYYDNDACVVLGKRKLCGTHWELQRTQCPRCAQQHQHHDRWRRRAAHGVGPPQ